MRVGEGFLTETRREVFRAENAARQVEGAERSEHGDTRLTLSDWNFKPHDTPIHNTALCVETQ